MLALFLLMVMNFIISWVNANAVGRMWSESKVIGGSLRTLTVAGYVMAIGGFTMVYSNILLLLAPVVLPYFFPSVPVEGLVSLAADMVYVLLVTFLIPSGFIIWYHSAVQFWRRKTLAGGLNVAWNSYAQIRNTVNAARSLPGAFGRITKALFGGKGRKKGNAVLILCAVLIVILAVCGGWFTASAIMKKADAEYDGLDEFNPDF